MQVYAAFDTEDPRPILTPASTEKAFRNWRRKEIAEWLIAQANSDITFIAAIDHGVSFPLSYFKRYDIVSWPQFVDEFYEHWPTDDEYTYVEFIREGAGGPPD